MDCGGLAAAYFAGMNFGLAELQSDRLGLWAVAGGAAQAFNREFFQKL
jgi:hypothetical protein